ncbi:MAG: 30S ribosomal protein S8 [Chloroflexi bacterium]|nr:30S ribosomal protein S8 [Chloroflexota bacterium]
MNTTDPIADMLTRVRNAVRARHETVSMPTSRLKEELARILKEEGYVKDFALLKGPTSQKVLRIQLSYSGRKEPVLSGLRRVSRPGLRVYVSWERIPRVRGGLGLAIVTTPQGVLTGREARRRQVGGELLCYVW